MNREPVVTVSSIVAVVAAALAVGTAFGLHLSKEQTAAIMGAVTVLAPLVAGFIGRQFVTPVKAAKPAKRSAKKRPETSPFTGSH